MLTDDLRQLLGSGCVSTDPADLDAHSRDWWPLAMLRERRGDDYQRPAAVVRPSDTAAVAAVLKLAAEQGVPVVPYGGGSGVCGAAQALAGCVALDTRGLDSIAVDDASATVRAGAGVMGPALEAALNEHGLTLGHFPQSIDISTVGGWVATRSAGQKSSRYGRIDDMVLGLTVVLAGGRIVTFPPRAGTSAGPDLMRVFLGSEGTLGVIVDVTLRACAIPGTSEQAAFGFDTFAQGLSAMRAIAQAGLHPAVCRLYDEADAAIAFREQAPGGCVLVLRVEEDATLIDGVWDAIARHLREGDARPLGPDLADHWWSHRNAAVETLRKIMFEEALGATGFADTLEVSGLWPVDALYEAVRDAVAPHADVVGCHASHLYSHGTCLYYTFVIASAADDDEVERRYRDLWSAAMAATLGNGGSITHHHGVGLLRLPWIEQEAGSAMTVLRAVKAALDPLGIMNPGKVIP